MNNLQEFNELLKNSAMYKELNEVFRQKIFLMDGAMGTCLQACNLKSADFGGEEFEGCNEHLNLVSPSLIQKIHEQYFAAGADAVETNSFGSTPLVLGEYGLESQAYEISRQSALIARKAREKYHTMAHPRYVAGSVGPTTRAISVTGGITFSELVSHFEVQIRGLIDGGVDFLLLETAQDTVNLKAALEGAFVAMIKTRALPVVISVTIESTGTMLAGQGAEAVSIAFSHLNLLALGMNCSTGPEFMTSHIRAFHQVSPFPVFCMPNAGLPNEEGKYTETPRAMGEHIEKFFKNGWLQVIGGCCGTNPEYIRWFDQIRQGVIPPVKKSAQGLYLCGIDFLEISDENRPVLIGERTNIIGSKKFRDLIIAGKWEEASEVGRQQVKGGAQVLDVCLANPDRNELEDMKAFLPELTKKIKVPLMIDTTEDEVFEAVIPSLAGKCILNSVNLETGEKRFERVSALVRRHGGALVVGCIDEDPQQGMAVTRERKLEIARRSYQILTEKYGLKPQDLIFDPLVFPCGTGDENYLGSARETVEGIAMIKKEFPQCKTVLGISNVSFGLPSSGREVLNSVFLYHCTQAGLDFAIVNSQKLVRYSSICDQEKQLCERVLFESSREAVDEFVAFYRNRKSESQEDTSLSFTVEERLCKNLVEGSKDRLIEWLEEARLKYTPLEIINGPLMEGMAKVGKLFNENKLIVAEVLQSAGVMKAAVSHLEGFMEKTSDSRKGKVVLATVKGDVHDIGKNLVEIILSNNGYEIINLGIKVSSEAIIQACREHYPDFIGLSGLLVKSALQMADTAEDLKNAGIHIPLLVGGAALSRNFTDKKIALRYQGDVFYAVDAMTGLEIVNGLTKNKAAFVHEYKSKSSSLEDRGCAPKIEKLNPILIHHEELREQAPDFDTHVVELTSAQPLFSYLNEPFLYAQHLGFKGSIRISLEKKDEKAIKLYQQVEDLKKLVVDQNLFECKAVYRFFFAYSEGNDLYILDGNKNLLETISFPRQTGGKGLCASDFIAPAGKKQMDTMAMFALTTGKGVSSLVQQFNAKGDYFNAHLIQALAMETAEAFAEYLHHQIRQLWKIEESLSTKEMFQTKYQGIRLSFGYPACPDMENQKLLFRLLSPEKIGISLTESFMMEPEASVSALVFSHPQGCYFQV